MAEGKESIFVGLSKSEHDGNGRDCDNDTKFKTAYSLYRCQHISPTESASSDETQRPSSSHSIKSKSVRNKYSIEALVSTIEGDDETDLSNFMERKLSKGTVKSGSSSISAIDLSLGDSEPSLYLCYYNLIQQKHHTPSSAMTDDDLAKLGLEGLDIDLEMPDKSSSENNDLLVCLIAPADSQLDLFKSDLDKFCAQLLANLDFETGDVVKIAKPMLDNWFESTASYVSHCVQHLGSDTKYLIHAALTDANLEVKCSNEILKSEIKKFFEVCSLNELLSSESSEQSKSADISVTDGGHDLLINLDSPVSSGSVNRKNNKVKVTVTLNVDDENCNFENQGCTQYCEDWSAALENCVADNHIQLRHVIENYKLKAIQEMNTLQRLLKQAESDHYALYRCFMFLKECGNGEILLQHAEHAMCQTDQSEAEQILGVLCDHLTQSNPEVR